MSTAYANDEFTYCPIMIKINSQALIEKYNGNRYLMQVWHATKKEKMFEVPLKSKLKTHKAI